ncbi:MAG TPA: hypothetical protein PLU67_00360 [Candidatus Kapabacteria bacterium]|nr:hypothetical protein [Ignavibacteria bacterium]HOM03924.1 hypothetical protein [Candidatus Kapabacteria bacterium]HOQ49205.1 hypothetical protein [Candidatus Kapabacteria bacterium]HPP40694.1 hypothetical protein [Candidatus Kapabacteria bacterium]HPU23928.1 hypothetical protein [Candidatus Kapabacteria bacterium]
MYKIDLHITNYSYLNGKTSKSPFAVPASRAGKILRFKHYSTDAPI